MAEETAPKRVGVREFRGDLLNYMRQVQSGSSFLVTVRGEVVARIQPPAPADRPRRQPGALRGTITMAPDFDSMPDDLLAAMESGTV